MKPSPRLASLIALTVASSTAWASLPFYSPDYTFDNTTGTGYTYYFPFFLDIIGGNVTADGKAANTLNYYESNIVSHEMIATWRGQAALPTPQLDSVHFSAREYDINRYGWTCGRTELSNGSAQAAIWQPNGLRIDLPHLSSSFPDHQLVGGYATDISDGGIAVGGTSKYEGNETKFRPVYWNSSREVVELANPLAASDQYWQGVGVSISPNGIIAGNLNFENTIHAIRWELDGTAQVLSKTTNVGTALTWTLAQSISDDGTIVGWGRVGSTNSFGVAWTPDGETIELQNLPNSTAQQVEVYEINNNHYSIGKARNSLGKSVAVRWSPTGDPLALNRLPDIPSGASDKAYDINDLNFAVGWSNYGSTYERAVIWTPNGDAIDINTLAESTDEWDYFIASAITNTGWISGIGDFDPAGPSESYQRPFSILVPFAGTYGLGDANFDESIDFADLLILAQNYGTETNGNLDAGDFNLDGVINFTDLLVIAQNYGDEFALLPNSENSTFPSDWQTARAMVPEPNAIGGLIAVSLTLRSRRR